MRLDDYVRLTGVSRSVASRELREYYDLPDSQISTFGRGTSKVYVKRNYEGQANSTNGNDGEGRNGESDKGMQQ